MFICCVIVRMKKPSFFTGESASVGSKIEIESDEKSALRSLKSKYQLLNDHVVHDTTEYIALSLSRTSKKYIWRISGILNSLHVLIIIIIQISKYHPSFGNKEDQKVMK